MLARLLGAKQRFDLIREIPAGGKFTNCSLLAICNFLSARMRKLITVRARTNKRTAGVLANARKDRSILLVLFGTIFRQLKNYVN